MIRIQIITKQEVVELIKKQSKEDKAYLEDLLNKTIIKLNDLERIIK